MAITANLDDAPAWGEFVPDGQYLCAVATANEDVSKSSNNDMIVLQCGILAGEHAGRTLPKDYLVFSKGGLSRVAYTLKALGVPITKGNMAVDAGALVGRKALVTVKLVTEKGTGGYEDREVLRIMAYDPAPTSAQDNAVDAALGGSVAPTNAPIASDDEIPFAYLDGFTVDSL